MSRPFSPYLSQLLARCQQARRDASTLKDLSELASRRLHATVRTMDARCTTARVPETPPAPIVSKPGRWDHLR